MEMLGDGEPLGPDDEPAPVRQQRPSILSTGTMGIAALGLAFVGTTGSFFLVNVTSFWLYSGSQEPPTLLRQYVAQVIPQTSLMVAALALGVFARLRARDTTPPWAWVVANASIVLSVAILVLLVVGGLVVSGLDEPEPGIFSSALGSRLVSAA